MMTKNTSGAKHVKTQRGDAPRLDIPKIGIVSRDYREKFANGYKDFSHALPNVLKLLDDKGCDAVLFSLYSIVLRELYDPRAAFTNLGHIRAIFLEEFQDGKCRKAGRYIVYHRTSKGWTEYEFSQVFGTITEMSRQDIDDFVKKEMPKRILGNCCVLLCGETNGVKYSPKDKKVQDEFKLRAAIPSNVNIILNPIHDRMTRFEMKRKRQFLSENGRWVISVWNKGKKDKNGKTRDGFSPAWTVFHDGNEKDVVAISNQLGVEIGILDFSKA